MLSSRLSPLASTALRSASSSKASLASASRSAQHLLNVLPNSTVQRSNFATAKQKKKKQSQTIANAPPSVRPAAVENPNAHYKKLPIPDDPNATVGRIVAVTSGKGGVGKTTSAASFAMGIASKKPDKTVCVIDFDIGLRNLDIHLGAERRVVFDFINVINNDCTVSQALIKDKRFENLSMLAASQTKDKDSLTVEGVEHVLASLAESFDYVILDSPAGIESGARHAMYFADDAIVVTNPELSSCRDADKMIGFISARSRRAEMDKTAVTQTLLITRYDPERADKNESLSISDIQDLLGLDLVGVIPESKAILTCTNLGTPVITSSSHTDDPASGAYSDMVDRFLGEEKEWRFTTAEPASFFKRIFG
ncbi:hypothetical protein TL16_g01044 [Triparma laevis f. inornata]|uniref:AAA domain-containing protein n=2 Tax=Triparma laevis TaxID=1534972 RepID=A0A9W7KZB3_9STRA|nr:hypothetical protein TL16_g01044 [Triparma laevis f. inornata]GMI16894.1 hypothetical protein TrLO_g1721 [Triparma laevis f. longispina]